MRRALTTAAILLGPLVLAAAFLAANAPGIVRLIVGPPEDPSLSCVGPDPTPLVSTGGAALVLQACAAGKTFTVRRGDAVAVDLAGYRGADTSDSWHDLTVSDTSVLGTVAAPSTVFGETQDRYDYHAIYRAIGSGPTTISALMYRCVNLSCGDWSRWKVTVHVG